MLRKFIGDREFYRRTLAVTIPIIAQNGITQFVNLLDNIMVGQVGTQAMTGVAIVNQLFYVFNLCIFGAVSGAGIFGAQFFGRSDHDGLRYVFRFKLIIAGIICAVGISSFLAFDDALISLFLRGEGSAEDIAAALGYGKEYLAIMCIGLVPFAAVQVYSGTLRETGQTVVPMKAGIAAVLTNLIGNYILIFGKFGAPALGAAGAAIATVASRFVEFGVIAVWTHRHKDINKFIAGAYKSLYIPGDLCRRIIVKGTPILANEALWSAGMSVLTQCYSVRGFEVVSAINISSTISNLFAIVTMALGSSISIIVGQALGTGDMERARDTDNKLIAFSLVCSSACAVLMVFASPFIAGAYNVTDGVKTLATDFLIIASINMPMRSFCNSCYFTLRSGGKTLITFLFDSVSIWTLSVPLAYCLAHFTSMDIVTLYLCCNLIDLVKCAIGYVMVKRGKWLHNLVAAEA